MSRRNINGRKTLSMVTGAGIALLAGVASVQAEGGFSEPGYTAGGSATAHQSGEGSTSSSSTGSVVYSSPDVQYSSTVSAEANSYSTSGGIGSSVAVGNNATVEIDGAGTVDQTSTSKMTSYTKNGGSLSKGRSETLTTVTVGGQKVLVADDVAKAAARSTPFGSSSATATELNISGEGNGYVGGTVTTDKTIRTTK